MSIPVLTKVIVDNHPTAIVYVTEGTKLLDAEYHSSVCTAVVGTCSEPTYSVKLSDSTEVIIGESTPLAVWKDGEVTYTSIAGHNKSIVGLEIPFTTPNIPSTYSVSDRTIPPDVLAEYLLLNSLKVYDGDKFRIYSPKAYKKFIKFLMPEHIEFIEVDDKKDVAMTSSRLEFLIKSGLLHATVQRIPESYLHGDLGYSYKLINALFKSEDGFKSIKIRDKDLVAQLAIVAASIGYALSYTEVNNEYSVTVSYTQPRKIVNCIPYHTSHMATIITDTKSPLFLYNYLTTY